MKNMVWLWSVALFDNPADGLWCKKVISGENVCVFLIFRFLDIENRYFFIGFKVSELKKQWHGCQCFCINQFFLLLWQTMRLKTGNCIFNVISSWILKFEKFRKDKQETYTNTKTTESTESFVSTITQNQIQELNASKIFFKENCLIC